MANDASDKLQSFFKNRNNYILDNPEGMYFKEHREDNGLQENEQFGTPKFERCSASEL